MSIEGTVYIVDDDPAVVDSLAALVEGMGLRPVCSANAASFFAVFQPAGPSCLVLDLRLPGTSGLELQRQLVARGHAPPVIMITGHGDVATCVEAMKRGVLDFLEKPYSPRQLRELIVRALELDDQRRRTEARLAGDLALLAQLTASERAVAEKIARGHTNRNIAAELDISLRTVQLRRASVMDKLQLTSRADLVRLVLSPAWQIGAGSPPPGGRWRTKGDRRAE